VGASALRSRWVVTSATRWEDIGGYDTAKLALQKAVEWPRQRKAAYDRLQLQPPRGALLYGPPGCSKTMLVKALARSSGASFLSVSAADVFSPFVGDAEAAIRKAFRLARSCSPSILFFDEIDAVVMNRGSGDRSGGGSVESRVLATFLNEMDGISATCSDGVTVMAATNRPAEVDSALLRPGRFELSIYIGPPDVAARRAILSLHVHSMPTSHDVSVERLVEQTKHFTGAEIANLCREAAMLCFHDHLRSGDSAFVNVQVGPQHFDEAIRASRPLLGDPEVRSSYSERAMWGRSGHAEEGKRTGAG